MRPAGTLPGLLARSALDHGARPALVPPAGEPVSFSALARRAGAVSRALVREGVRPGEIVGLLAPNGPEWAVAFFGILGAGAPVLPLDPHLTPAELANALGRFDCGRVLCEGPLAVPGVASLPLEPSGGGEGSLPEPRSGDLAVLLASSGTTGLPKGVMLSHANLLANLDQFRRALPVGPEDAFLALLPLHHAFPLVGSLLAALSCGGRAVFPAGARPDALVEAVASGRVSLALLVPGVLRLMLKALERGGGAEALGAAFRAVIVGGAACPLSVLEACGRLGVPVLQGYGMSEASPVIAVNTFGADRPGTVGRPVPGVEVRIEGASEGEVLVRGPNVMMGYYGDPARTAEVLRDGWLRTGDIGALDAEGFLTLRGRSKNVIIGESGKNVYPEEIEAELARSELIRECCVVGRAAEGSERIVAVLVPQGAVAEERLRAEVRSRCGALAEYKRVQDVVVWQGDLPRTAAGKVRVAELRKALASGARGGGGA